MLQLMAHRHALMLGPQLLGGDIKYADAQIVPANTSAGALPGAFTGTAPSTAKVPVAYCLVVLSYSSTRAHDPTPQNITIIWLVFRSTRSTAA